MLRPRERRRPQMPNQLSRDDRGADRRVLARASRSRAAPDRGASWPARSGAALVVSPNGVYKTLRRHGLNTRAKRLALVAGYRAPYEPPREPEPEPHIDHHAARASWSASTASTSGACTAPGAPVWQLTAIDTYSSLRLGRARRLRPTPGPTVDADQHARAPRRRATSRARRLAARARAHRQRQRVPPPRLRRAICQLGARHTRIRAGRPQTNGHVERLHRTILEECWRPAFARYLHPRYTGLRRDLDALPARLQLRPRPPRPHHPRPSPAELVYGARKMEPR